MKPAAPRLTPCSDPLGQKPSERLVHIPYFCLRCSARPVGRGSNHSGTFSGTIANSHGLKGARLSIPPTIRDFHQSRTIGQTLQGSTTHGTIVARRTIGFHEFSRLEVTGTRIAKTTTPSGSVMVLRRAAAAVCPVTGRSAFPCPPASCAPYSARWLTRRLSWAARAADAVERRLGYTFRFPTADSALGRTVPAEP